MRACRPSSWFQVPSGLMSWASHATISVGVLPGTIIGVLPGLGPVATISILLPFTFGLQPQTDLIMLAGISYDDGRVSLEP